MSLRNEQVRLVALPAALAVGFLLATGCGNSPKPTCTTTCSASQYQVVDCTATADRVCASCSAACPTGQFQSTACTASADRVCTGCSTSCPTGQFQSTACGASADRVCTACSGSCTTGQYQSAACSATADRACTACSTSCPAGEVQTSPCTATADRVCGNCPTTFAGKATTTFGSNWVFQAQTGLAAGTAACVALGADHVCDYDDVVYAASRSELSALTTADTAWLQRTHPVTVGGTSPTIVVLGAPATSGTTYKVNQGGSNCANWAYSTDHLNDGEWVDFSTGVNTPTFHLDDNPCAIQTLPKDIPCGHNLMQRSVLCCFAKSSCNPAVSPSLCTCNAGQCM